MAAAGDLDGEVVEVAFALAVVECWHGERLSAMAARKGMPLAAIGDIFAAVDAVATGAFGQPRRAGLAVALESIAGEAADARLASLPTAWLDHVALPGVIATAASRLALHPRHRHHWVLLLFEPSRLLLECLDVARVPGRCTLRARSAVAATLVALAIPGDREVDGSPDLAMTECCLWRSLACAGGWARRSCAGR
jgi:hypothetical protein